MFALTHSPTHALTAVRPHRLLAAILATAVSTTGAQSAIYGAGLQAWTGCWSAAQSLASPAGGALICISPTANVNVANVTSLDGSVVAHEIIDATGHPLPLDAEGCTGTRHAAWSRDSRRLFLRTTGACNGIPLAISGIFSISAAGEWLDVEGISRGGGTSVRVARYRDVGVPPGLAPDVAQSIQANALARRSTRAAFSAPIHLDDVIDAARFVQADVVAAWILERAQQVVLTERDLASLDQSELPPQVANALFAVADSAATLARAPDDPSSYDERSAGDGSNAESTDAGYDLPPWYWGASYSVPDPTRRGGGSRFAHPHQPRYPPFYHPPIVALCGGSGAACGAHERGGTHQGPRDSPSQPGASADDPRYAPSTPDRPSTGGTVRLGRPRS